MPSNSPEVLLAIAMVLFVSDRYAAYELDEGQEVGCALCMEQGDHTSYRRGQAYLQSGLLSPFGDGDAHYMCTRHLDSEAVIVRDL